MDHDDLAEIIRRFSRDLAVELDAHADPKTKAWWERYLKGEASFRGVKMDDVRRITSTLIDRHVTAPSPSVLVPLALALMEHRHTEDKLAGVLVLAEHALDELEDAHLDDLAIPLRDGHLADWNSVDWYSVKVLGPFLSAGDDPRSRVEAIARWRLADGMWQRRAAAVALTGLAAAETEAFPGFWDIALRVASDNATDSQRWSQTGVGWLLRELSRHHPDLVVGFLRDHPHLSAEATANASKYLPDEPAGG